MSKDVKVSGGITFPSLLTVLFIALKLTGYINWSWWWVLAPMWLPIAIIISIPLAAVLVGIILGLCGVKAKKERGKYHV